MHAMKASAGLGILLLLAACQRPPVPAHDKPPEPQAHAAGTHEKGDGGN